MVNKIFLFSILFFLIIATQVQAVASVKDQILKGNTDTGGGLESASSEAGYNTAKTEPVALIGQYIQYALSFLGVVFLCLIIYAGFIWMIARGNDSEVQRAKDIMIDAGFGLIIVLAGYAISAAVIGALLSASQPAVTP